MIVAVVGSRTISNKKLIFRFLDEFLQNINIKCIISGGAKGVDTIAELWAKENNIDFVKYLPLWNINKKGAGIRRNVNIVENSDLLMVFWDGSSKGTKNTIEVAEKLNKKIKVINFKLLKVTL
jgi:hypothetical protein